jgi:glycine/D-amino acid oxidase-like deaminating enzyme
VSGEHYDVVIVGGAATGSSIAYFLTHDLDFAGSVAVVERDPSYAGAATTLSAASIRQQFYTRENIRMSQFGIAFIKGLKARFAEDADLGFREGGYLILAGERGQSSIAASHRVQAEEGADVVLFNPDELAKKFPWLSTDGIALASYGRSGEGWFDAHALLTLLRNAARHKGAVYIHGDVVGIESHNCRVQSVLLRDGRSIACGTVVDAAGPQAGEVAALAGLALPVEPRKRCVFVVACRAELAGMPLIVDSTGVWIRPEGDFYICGVSPPESADPAASDFEVDYGLFDQLVWPALASRIPAMEALKLVRAWAGHYDFNILDQNVVLGPHPRLENFLFAAGSSGHGLQHAPAIGRGIAELIVHGRYVSLDLSALGYDRIASERPLRELNVI